MPASELELTTFNATRAQPPSPLVQLKEILNNHPIDVRSLRGALTQAQAEDGLTPLQKKLTQYLLTQNQYSLKYGSSTYSLMFSLRNCIPGNRENALAKTKFAIATTALNDLLGPSAKSAATVVEHVKEQCINAIYNCRSFNTGGHYMIVSCKPAGRLEQQLEIDKEVDRAINTRLRQEQADNGIRAR